MQAAPQARDYDFTVDWFSPHWGHWLDLIAQLRPRRVLEIGCYEGRATTYFIGGLASQGLQLTCIDTWAGGGDLPSEQMIGVESRFDHNVALAIEQAGTPHLVDVYKVKQRSARALARLIAEGFQPFDLIYVDGSHTAPDVLTDAVLAFQLLRPGGAMVFDDYRWQFEPQGRQDALNMPKPAIDAFINLNMRELVAMPFGHGNWQMLVLKAAEQ